MKYDDIVKKMRSDRVATGTTVLRKDSFEIFNSYAADDVVGY